jgi:hypothetical protein
MLDYKDRMENEDLKNMVQETLNIARENNNLLKKMRRSQRWGNISRIVYWLILIGISVGAFYYIQPYLEKAYSLYTEGLSDYTGLKDAGASFFKTQPK